MCAKLYLRPDAYLATHEKEMIELEVCQEGIDIMAAKRQKKIKKIDGVAVHCSYDAIVLISKLRPNPDNPNSHPDEQIELLSKMIAGEIVKGKRVGGNGWRDRIRVSNRSGMIVKGHGLYLAAIKAGLTKAPVDFQDYATESEEIADLIGDNKISDFSIIDEQAAQALIDSLDVSFDMQLAGFEIVDGDGGDPGASGGKEKKPEVEFTQEILLEHNYVVLYFDNLMDWQVALDKFQLKRVKDLIPRKGQPIGIGRVLKGAEWLDRIK